MHFHKIKTCKWPEMPQIRADKRILRAGLAAPRSGVILSLRAASTAWRGKRRLRTISLISLCMTGSAFPEICHQRFCYSIVCFMEYRCASPAGHGFIVSLERAGFPLCQCEWDTYLISLCAIFLSYQWLADLPLLSIRGITFEVFGDNYNSLFVYNCHIRQFCRIWQDCRDWFLLN